MRIMGLVLVWVIISLIGMNTFAQTYRPRPARLMSQHQRYALDQRMRPHVVTIARKGKTRRGIRTLNSPVQFGEGLRLTSQLVLTADQWLDISPHESAYTVKVWCGRTHEPLGAITGKVSKRSQSDGWALLVLQHPLNCGSSSQDLLQRMHTLAEVNPETGEPHLYSGQRLYALEAPPLMTSPLDIQGKAPGAFAFYWLISGRLLPGTPLFDQEGHWRTLSAGISRQVLDVSLTSSQSLTLPVDAHQNALKEARQLRP